MPSQGQAKRRSATTQSTEKPAKRKRVSRACDQCRISREKCDGLQPTCSTCSASKRGCAYTANPKKRGIQPGYIRSLELALAWLFQQNPGNETLLNDSLAQEGASSLFVSRDSKESNRLHKRWRKARFYTDVDKLLSGGEPSRHDRSEPLSPQSDDDDDSDAKDLSTIMTSYEPSPNQVLQAKVRSGLPPHPQPAPLQHPTVDTGTTSIPSDSWRLVETYFTYTQCWLPICEKHDILKLSYSYPASGLHLSSNQADSGSHAELWSVLAVASLYITNHRDPVSQSNTSILEPVQLYQTARSLVPAELGSFDLGHIKALLNLAIFNIVHSLTEAAWLLVGYASRMLDVLDQLKLLANSRRKHVFSSCFLLDSMLALQLEKRPYFQKCDLEQLGMIDEDGLEEWQPWTGYLQTSSLDQTRTPMFALSTFNGLLTLVDMLISAGQPSPPHAYNQDAVDLLKSWENSLPPKLDYIRSELESTPLTPPAVLLQVTYCCASFNADPSKPELHRLLQILERWQKQIGLESLPPIIQCLMDIVSRRSIYLGSDDVIRNRLQRLQIEITRTGPGLDPKERSRAHNDLRRQSTHYATAIQMPTPDSINNLFPYAQPIDPPAGGDVALDASSPIGVFIPGAQTTTGSLPIAPGRPQSDPRYPEFTSDLEGFFDELASLDSATKLDNQPQFMQNLGFAPDASMADLFSEYIPMQSSSMRSSVFLPQDDPAPVNFDQYSFYTAG